MAHKILTFPNTVSDIFYPDGQFVVQLTGLGRSSQEWFLQSLPRELADSSSEWTEVTTQPFANSAGRRSLTFQGSEGFKYRIANTNGSPTNPDPGVEAYWDVARTTVYR